MPRGIPNAKRAPKPDDEHDNWPVQQRIVPASVFAVAKAASPPRAKPVDPDQVVIQSGVLIPPQETGRGSASPYAVLLSRMQPGDMVELPVRQSYGLFSAAKRLKIETARRTQGGGMVRIWRK